MTRWLQSQLLRTCVSTYGDSTITDSNREATHSCGTPHVRHPAIFSQASKKSDDERSPIPHTATQLETVVNDTLMRQPSHSPSKKSSVKTPTSPLPPNRVLPTWNDTFYSLPRSALPHAPPSALSKTLQYISGVLFSRDEAPSNKGKGKVKEHVYSPYDKAPQRTWDVVCGQHGVDIKGCKRVVVIEWFPGRSPWMCHEFILTRGALKVLSCVHWLAKLVRRTT